MIDLKQSKLCRYRPSATPPGAPGCAPNGFAGRTAQLLRRHKHPVPSRPVCKEG